MRKILLFWMVLAACATLAATADAGTIDAGAVISASPDGSDFDYTIKLTNTSGAGNDSIASFWFAWVPGADFMATKPLSVTDPSGWHDNITHGGASDGYAIQYDANATANFLAPGGSLTFAFTSADTPADLMGNSIFFNTFPVLTSFVYSLAPLRGDGQKILVGTASVPEPSSLVLGGFGAVGALVVCRRRRRTKA